MPGCLGLAVRANSRATHRRGHACDTPAGYPANDPPRGAAAQVDALVAGVAAQLPGGARALCTRRALRHVLLALQAERDALLLDGDDVVFCI